MRLGRCGESRMLCVWVQLSGERIQLQCRRCRTVLHLIFLNMESTRKNHDRLSGCESELQLPILDPAERRPNCPCDCGDCPVLLYPKNNDVLHPCHFDVLSPHIHIRSLHYDHNGGSRTRGAGDEFGYLCCRIYNIGRGERWCSYTNRGLLCPYQ